MIVCCKRRGMSLLIFYLGHVKFDYILQTVCHIETKKKHIRIDWEKHFKILQIFLLRSNNHVTLATFSFAELLLLENSHYTEQKSYKFEDFFWTGSGDGPTDENMWTSDGPAIIYKTSTVISTVFVETPSTQANEVRTNFFVQKVILLMLLRFSRVLVFL